MMADAITIHPLDDIRTGAVLAVDEHHEGEPRGTTASQNDIESTLSPWICVLGAFAFIMPSFGRSHLQSKGICIQAEDER